ncbi:MAG: HdeD family acid-resistance protein [Chloroflexota bacterium]|nr:HdeD family acid-resistance protein [Anaerolineae bacterium]
MLTMLSRNWWLVALRGVIAILFGLVTLFFPGIALSSFVLLFGAYAIIDGLAAVWSSVQHRTEQGWWIHLLEGVVSVIAGILAFVYPGITALIALYIIAFWAIMTGVFELLAAIRLRKEITGEFWMGLSGVISVIFGIVLIAAPGAGILAVLTLVGIYAIAFGVFLIMLSLRLRSHATHSNTPTHTMA